MMGIIYQYLTQSIENILKFYKNKIKIRFSQHLKMSSEIFYSKYCYIILKMFELQLINYYS